MLSLCLKFLVDSITYTTFFPRSVLRNNSIKKFLKENVTKTKFNKLFWFFLFLFAFYCRTRKSPCYTILMFSSSPKRRYSTFPKSSLPTESLLTLWVWETWTDRMECRVLIQIPFSTSTTLLSTLCPFYQHASPFHIPLLSSLSWPSSIKCQSGIKLSLTAQAEWVVLSSKLQLHLK